MVKFLIFLALGLVVADKLDRKYLPPPGAKYSGGNPEELQVSLELPKETPQFISLMPVAPDNNLLRSDSYFGSIFRTNVGNNIENTSRSKSLQRLSSNTSPTTSFTYSSKTSSGFDYETSNKLLDISQKHLNIKEQIYDNDLPRLLYQMSGEPVSDNGATNIQSFEPKLEEKSELRKYQYQNQEIPVLASENTNTQYRDYYRYNQSNPFYYGQETSSVSKPANIPEFNVKNLMPTINNYLLNKDIRPSQYAVNAKIINDTKFHNNSQQNNSDSLTAVSNFKPSPSNIIPASHRFSTTMSRSLSSRINNRITPSRTQFQAERSHAESDRNAIILKYHNVITPEGFSYSYDTSNSISASESGTTDNGVRAKGAYSYTGDDGKVYRVVYTADENGFQPRGEHLPSLPIAIQRLAEKATSEKDFGITDDGSYDESKYGHKNYHGAMERYHPEFQGFSNNGINQLGYYPRKSFRDDNTARPRSSNLEINRKNIYHHKQAVYQDESNVPMQDNRVTVPANQGIFALPLNNSTTKSASIQNLLDSKAKSDPFDESQNIDKEEKSLLAFPIEQEKRTQSLSKTIDMLSPEHSKQALLSNNNIPEIIANSNVCTKNGQEDLHNERDGYFYIKPLNKFYENASKDKDQFDSDQELEIGDDDIITISVPVPSTSIRPVNESLKTTSPLNQQFSIGNGAIPQSNVNIKQEANPEFTMAPLYTVESTTPLSLDVNIQANRPSHEPRTVFAILVNPTENGSRNGEYSHFSQQPQKQTFHNLNAALNMLNGGYKTAVDENVYVNPSPTFYGQNQNLFFPNFEKRLSVKNFGRLGEVNGDKVTNPGDIRSDYSDLLQEDFTGPTRPQTFDPKAGYYY